MEKLLYLFEKYLLARKELSLTKAYIKLEQYENKHSRRALYRLAKKVKDRYDVDENKTKKEVYLEVIKFIGEESRHTNVVKGIEFWAGDTSDLD